MCTTSTVQSYVIVRVSEHHVTSWHQSGKRAMRFYEWKPSLSSPCSTPNRPTPPPTNPPSHPKLPYLASWESGIKVCRASSWNEIHYISLKSFNSTITLPQNCSYIQTDLIYASLLSSSRFVSLWTGIY